MSAASSPKNSIPGSSNASKELCIVCQNQPYDLICTCGDKFDFTCIHLHVEQIGQEFQYIQVEVGQRLLQVEQNVEDNNCTNAKTIVENWKRKRIQDINDIADDILNEIQDRENAYTDVPLCREKYNSLCENSHRVVHEQLDSLVILQREIFDKSDQLQTLPELLRDDINLDSKLQSKLNPNISIQNSIRHEIEPIISSPITSTTILMNTETIISGPTSTSNEHLTTNSEPAVELMNNDTSNHVNISTNESVRDDEFEAGHTAYIQRRNPIIISTDNHPSAGTICSHENQLLYNAYDQRTQTMQLVLIPDITQPTKRDNIDWTQSDLTTSSNDDNSIQDMTYSTKLQGYLLLTHSSLHLLKNDTNELEEFYQFRGRKMKRVTCNDTYIYLISAAGTNDYNGDEILLMNYDREEKVYKTFRDVTSTRGNYRIAGQAAGEITDIAVNTDEQVIISYRFERRHEVGVCSFNVSNDGNNWQCIKQLLLNECWHEDSSFTPRIEWCEKLNVFILIEFITSHLIMIDEIGQIKGECRFMHIENRTESPLNLTISNNDWLCLRYESSINIHRLEDKRFGKIS